MEWMNLNREERRVSQSSSYAKGKYENTDHVHCDGDLWLVAWTNVPNVHGL